MTQEDLEKYINHLLASGKLWKFYKHPEWMELRQEVLNDFHNECQDCKKRGIHTRAGSVHHAQYVRSHPRLALSKTYMYDGKEYQNLIPLCKACHNARHPEKGNRKRKDRFMNEERW
ncbi:HNH endonuclease [Lachnospiraceae bacterium ASD4241]|uniref:HNH endonuclease n=2 Tax=Diplocloster modestus TaxID=2850322 RepID=A0ABS6KCN6_9FIRM|nr:HNH endonuclease [Diplocloster modestus]